MHHHEQTDRGTALARSERFADTHVALGSFIRGEAARIAAAVDGEPMVLFKEKVNYKHPGGAGFAAHQDARAYRFCDYHVSLMVPLEAATVQNGCLWFASNPGRELLPSDSGGRIAEEVAQSLDWRPVEVEAGDVVVFDSRSPHRSGTNDSPRSRRALYLTYNRAFEGDLRARYYEDKDAELRAGGNTFDGERVRISISDDFLGRPVGAPGSEQLRGADVLAGLYVSEEAERLYDEDVTEAEHALQAAALAEAEGAPADLVAAALLHDVGHLLAGDLVPLDEDLGADAHHEAVGARFLRRFFDRGVTDPIALHVSAKRYLCAVETGYSAKLSPSSVRSMAAQGGPMNDAEVAAFEALPHHDAAVRLRRWDDLAKVSGKRTPGFDHYRHLLVQLQSGA